MAEQTQFIIHSIVQFLRKQLDRGKLSHESAEGVEVAIQCLESAYELSEFEINQNGQTAGDSSVSCTDEILSKHFSSESEAGPSCTASNKLEAEKFKNEGNEYMSSGKFKEAYESYTKAIQKDESNAMYYCNRAAASSKLNQHEKAIADCQKAISITPTYSKAYSRLGLAYSSLGLNTNALRSYERAHLLEPENSSYKNNYDIARAAEERQMPKSNSSPVNPLNIDLANIFSNPALINMASQMLANPTMQTMVGNILAGNLNTNSGGMDAFLQASQQIAAQLENGHPELCDTMRQTVVQSNIGTATDEHHEPVDDKNKED